MGHANWAGSAAAALLLGPLLLPAAVGQDRGELLYTTHCVACHTEQLHWRDKRQAVDWPSLAAQVRLWQATGALGWSEDDITQVTRFLNEAYYRFAPPLMPQALAWRRAHP